MTDQPNIPNDERDDLLADRATGDAPRDNARPDGDAVSEHDETAAALHRALAPQTPLPDRVKAQLIREGEAVLGGITPQTAPPPAGSGWRIVPWLAAAAAIGIAATVFFVGTQRIAERERLVADAQQRVEDMERRAQNNARLLEDANTRLDATRAELASTDSNLSERERAIVDAQAENLRLAEQLVAATDQLTDAKLRLAFLEQPDDPETTRQNRELLLDVPGTIRIAWTPFDFDGLPAPEQSGDVTGDIIWNDGREQGYLRFVGLDPNDPAVEQYQVWIIDERGLEQKVSGGVFDVTLAGEVIVPIEPGIDVGRVKLFAITVENPGGTWVPDLQRRIVIGARDDG